MNKKTKIVATVGPASQSQSILEEMIKVGVDTFRLNFSHGTHDYHKTTLDNIRMASAATGKFIGILQDISGPKVRIGELEEDTVVKPGDTIKFVREDVTGYRDEEGNIVLSLNRPELLDKLLVGDLIYLCDGTINARITQTGDYLIANIISGGKLSSHKGVNFPGTRLDISVLTEKDKKDIEWGVQNGVDFMAISFVQKASDMVFVRHFIEKLGGDVKLIAKIEKFDAVENFDEILKVSDGIMVARGDLGIEIPYYRVPKVQKELIKKANEASKPIITATQMLLSMTESSRATRAEISDVANAVLDGSDALMLSEESAVGRYPVQAAETMSLTIQEAEKIYKYDRFHKYSYFDDMDVIDESVVLLSKNIDSDAIIAVTSSGQSARKISRYRPSKKIYAVPHTEKVARELSISWGVKVLSVIAREQNLYETITAILHKGIDCGKICIDKCYIMTAGDPSGKPGTTNTIRVLRGEEISFFMDRDKHI